jgi:two-component system, chemotaxis family, CheB/CheR fusion protein
VSANHPQPAFPIVGIGASAGGLAAIEAFFSGLPRDVEPGMAFVVVQHLAPDHESMLAELVRRCTDLQVTEVQDGVAVQPNCVYILPPNRDMALLHGTLRLVEPAAPRWRRLPVDFFFKSLAEDQHERAIGIVLSGSGSDGTLGVRAIKGEDGMVMAQDSGSAEHDGMPRSAIGTGLVDYVLPPERMLPALLNYASHAMGRLEHHERAAQEPRSESALKSIFVQLRARTGHDFSQYKQSTIHRRIERRMAVQQMESLEAYAQFLAATPAEVEALFRDLLIRVTSFFRDPEAFDALGELVAKQLLKGRPPGSTVRAWVPGCSTGEEAYSIAILLREQVESLQLGLRIQVFGTDIDLAAIEQARRGAYPVGIASELRPERLARHFELDAERDIYHVRKSVRDLLIFSEQDVIKDPPFSRLDLISCRNLMIYLGGKLQQELIPLFHYALNPGGMLFLGTSEGIGDHRELFTQLHAKSKIYVRRDDIPSARAPTSRMFPSMTQRRASRERRRLPLRELTERALLQHVTAAAALVNERGDLLFVHGRTGRFLEPPQGESNLNVLGMAREGLGRELTMALRESVSTARVVRRPGLRVRTNGGFTTMTLTVRPVTAEADGGPNIYVLIMEEDAAPAAAPPDSPAGAPAAASPDATAAEPSAETAVPPGTDAGQLIESLRRELREQARYLQTSRQDLELSNDELKGANDELQSLNEELQSTNEELETSKEELQSVNEELATVNAELQQRVTQLSRSNNDLNNLMAGTGLGTIFVDHDLRIQRFTPAATAVINLIPSDVGRPIGQLASNLVGYDRLVPDIQSVLNTLTTKDIEVHSNDEWYLLRIRPYRTFENVIEGAVITFTDISTVKAAQEALRRLAAVVRDSRDAIVVHDMEGRIVAWNPGAERLYGWTEAEAQARNIRDLVPTEMREEALAVVQQLGQAGSIRPYRTQRVARDGHLVEVELTSTALVDGAGRTYAISTTERALD